MRFSTILAACSFTSLAIASAVPEPDTNAPRANCGWPNGNCYANDCHGELSHDKITCTSGPYKGCQCGYNCGSKTGQCSDGGCEGVNNRCTNNYLGCSCLGP